MLVLNNVEVTYAGIICAIKNISLSVPDGKIVALMGSNGAGKTTTFKAISGLLNMEEGKITDGTIIFNDQRIDKATTDKIVKMGIVQIPEGRRVLENFTIEENLEVGGLNQSKSTVKNTLEKVYQYFPGLKLHRKRKSGYLSGGEQQMLVIGRALMACPKLMLVDEASLGLAPLMVEEIFRILKSINQEDKTSILLVEQNVNAALEIADHGYVMENGRIILDCRADELRGSDDIRQIYMGISNLSRKKEAIP